MANEANNIWMSEDPRYSRMGAAWPAYLSLPEQLRLERIRQGRMLFDGRHQELFLTEGRTQFSFRDIRKYGGAKSTLYVVNNVLRLVALKAADLLFGDKPLISSDDRTQDAVIADIVARSGLHQVAYQAAIDASVEGEAFLEAIIYDGQVYLQQVPGEEISPLGPLMPDGQYAAYVRRTEQAVGNKTLMLERTYRAGSIEHACYDVTDAQKKSVDLSQWKDAEGRSLTVAAPIVETGIAWNTITWIPNLMVRRRAVSDFDGVVGLQDVLNAKASQLSVVILKHAYPRLLMPEQLVDQNGNVQDAEVFFKRDGETAEYLTWDAQLDAAMKDRAAVLQLILVQTETSPVLLGLKEGAAPDAYRKVRLEAFNSITKAARRAVYWTEGLRTAMTSALMLSGTIPGNPPYVESQISVQLRDGIPVDEVDEANRLATLRGAGFVDDQWCLEQLLPDPTQVAEVLKRVKAGRAADMPSVLMNENGEVATDGAQMNTDESQDTGGTPVPQS